MNKRYFWVLAGAVAITVAAQRPARAADINLPSGWQGQDIGDPATPGSSVVDSTTGIWVVRGSGADLWDTASDHFHFVSTPVAGDGNITARMLGTTGGHLDDGWEKCGVMIRADFDPDSAMVHTEMTNRNSGVYWHWRDDKAGQPHDDQARAPREFPLWMRTQRLGNDFAGYISYNGTLWRNIGWLINEPGFQATSNFGLCTMSHDDNTIDTVTWDNVAINKGQVQVYGLWATGGDKSVTLKWLALKGAAGYDVFRGPAGVSDFDGLKPEQMTKITTTPVTAVTLTDSDASLTPATYTYGVAAVDSSGKDGPMVIVRANVGGSSSNVPGYTATSVGPIIERLPDFGIENKAPDTGADLNPATGVIRVRGGGADIAGTADNFTFIHQKVTGNFQLEVKALSFPTLGSNTFEKGGLMIREDVTPGSRFADLVLGSVKGLVFMSRTTKDGDTAAGNTLEDVDWHLLRDLMTAGVPPILRLTRTGDVIKSEFSLDGGTTFFESTSSPLTITGLANSLEVGLALTPQQTDDGSARVILTDQVLKDLKITPQ